jgi:uncharacterized protein YpmB
MKKWLIIGIILLVVIIVSVYFYNKSKKESPISTAVQEISNLRGGQTCRKCTRVDSNDTTKCLSWSYHPCDQIIAGSW